MAEQTTGVSPAGAAAPRAGEMTKAQDVRGIFDMSAVAVSLPGYLPAPEPSFAVYRMMNVDPTLALAAVTAKMPIRLAEVSFEAHDEVPEDRVTFVQDVLEPLWAQLLKDVLWSLHYGYAPFEKVWESRPVGGSQRWVYRKLKPLVADPNKTKVQVNKDTGVFAGLKQDAVELPPEKCFVYANEPEFGNLLGTSRHDNVREVWWQARMATGKEGQYVTKVAGVIPLIEYPGGKSKDASGAEQDNFVIGQRVLQNLGQGHGVLMPNELVEYAHDFFKAGGDLAKLKSWHIDMLETKGAHGEELLSIVRHKEALKLRGWLVPERAVSEGQYGTKAEAGEHADIALAVAGLVLDDVLRAVNHYLVDPLLIYNFGADAAGSVYMSAAGLSPEQQAFVRQVVQGVLTAPGNVDLFLKMIDYDALLDQVGLPKASEVVDIGDVQPGFPQGEAANAQARLQRQAEAIIHTIQAGRGPR